MAWFHEMPSLAARQHVGVYYASFVHISFFFSLDFLSLVIFSFRCFLKDVLLQFGHGTILYGCLID